jgi:hypothetical protein
MAAVVVGCSSSSSNGGAPDGGAAGGTCDTSVHSCTDTCDACTLVTQQEVSADFGSQVGAPVPQNGNCEWDYGDPLKATGGFDVVFDVRMDFATFQDECHPKSNGVIVVTPVLGVGDDACTIGAGTKARPILTFRKGCFAYSIGVNTAGPFDTQLTDDQILAAEKSLALKALPRL